MIKKSLTYSMLIMLLMMGKSSIAMHAAVLRFSKLAGASLAAYPAWNCAYSSRKERLSYRDRMPYSVKIWAQDILKECDINEKKVSFAVANTDETKGWGVIGNNHIIASPRMVNELVYNLQIIEDFHAGKATEEQLHMAQRIVACQEQFVKHECGHLWHQHYKKNMAALILGPCAVQMASSGVAAVSKNIFRIAPPVTFLRTSGFCLLAVGTALPKVMVTKYFFEPDQFMHEKQADEFAWNNAKTDGELRALKDFYQALAANPPGPFSEISNVTTALEYYDAMSEQEKEGLRIGGYLDRNHASVDKDHPTSLARAKSIQSYINVMGKR